MTGRTADALSNRQQLLAGALVEDLVLQVGGVDTAVLVGGQGPPVVLLHGPGEVAATWLPILGKLVDRHRVIVPDLPGHGESDVPGGGLDARWVEGWLESLVAGTCSEPPALVGRVTGGALAARFVAGNRGQISHLVLVDATGLVPFEPDARFELALQRFLADPTSQSFARAMDFCAFDLDAARSRLGDRWAPYSDYVVELLRTPRVQAAMGFFIGLYAAPPIPPEVLDRIDIPTTLIWGRYDLATPLEVAEKASERYGWPLQVIDGAGDDPPLDQPGPFVEALRAALASPVGAAS